MKHPIIVTGATGSMGSVAARSLSSEGYPVILACRNLSKGQSLYDSIKTSQPDAELELIELNLESLIGVRSFLDIIGDRKLSGIFNNAGVISREYSRTVDGYEHTMAVNFLYPAALTYGLLDNFVPGSHIVNMVSLTTRFVNIDAEWNLLCEKDFNRLRIYAMSKLALLNWTVAFARHSEGLYVNVSDPGVVNSNMISMGKWFDPLADIFFRPFISSPEKGVQPALSALHFDGSLQYFVGRRHHPISEDIQSDVMPSILYEQVRRLGF